MQALVVWMKVYRAACKRVYFALWHAVAGQRSVGFSGCIPISPSVPLLTYHNSGLSPYRGQLIRTAQQLLEVFHERQQVWPATQEAWVATGCKPAAPAGLGPVLQLAKGALDGMELAREGIMGVVDCLLDWMAQLHKEMGRVWQLQKAPREDLLRVSPGDYLLHDGGKQNFLGCSKSVGV